MERDREKQLVKYFCIQCGTYKKTLNHYTKDHVIHVTDKIKMKQYHEKLFNRASSVKQSRFPVDCPSDCPYREKKSLVTETALIVAKRIKKMNFGDEILTIFLNQFIAVFESEENLEPPFKYLYKQLDKRSAGNISLYNIERNAIIKWFKAEILKEMKKNGAEMYLNAK